MEILTIIGAKYLFLFSILIALEALYNSDENSRKKLLYSFMIALPLAYLCGELARQIYFNPRPFVVGDFTPLVPHSPDNGFPSDHALLTGALASVVNIFNRKRALVLWLIAIAVGISRMLDRKSVV